MITITLKAKHFYYISYYLRTGAIEKYFSLVGRIKTALVGNTDLEASFGVSATPEEVIDIFKILSFLPEGQSASINKEMVALIEPQINNGAGEEGMNGIGPDIDGNLPENAYWQRVAKGIQFIDSQNIEVKNGAISAGKVIIDTI